MVTIHFLSIISPYKCLCLSLSSKFFVILTMLDITPVLEQMLRLLSHDKSHDQEWITTCIVACLVCLCR